MERGTMNIRIDFKQVLIRSEHMHTNAAAFVRLLPQEAQLSQRGRAMLRVIE